MSGRYKQSGPRDEPLLTEGDASFIGVDMRRDPNQLEAGMVSEAVNMSFRQGKATPRNGFQTRPWASEGGADFNWDFPVSFDNGVGFGRIYGACTFSDPYGNESVILACANRSYQIAGGAPIATINYPADVVIDDEVEFTQAFNTLIMWRGEQTNPLKLDTALQFSENQVWEEVPDETDADYTSTIPDAVRGTHYGNRVWVGFGTSKVAYSDILSYTRYDATLSTIYVNEGDSDRIQILFPFGENAILAFKDRSIYALTDILPSPGELGRLQTITRQRGTIAPLSVTQCGKDVWFLADDGVYTINQTMDNSLQASADPVSAPLQPLFDRVNWAAAKRAQGLYLDGKFFLAIPIDGEQHNNAIAIYDFLTNLWCGWWEFDWLDAFRMVRMNVGGRRRLFIVSGNTLGDANTGVLYMLGDDYQDERFTETRDVETEMLTRGYTGGITDTKTWLATEVEIATWYGAGTFLSRRDGINEEGPLVAYQKDRRKYETFATPDYDPSNVNADHGAPYRQDYSVELGSGGVNFAPGIALGLHQFSSERMRIREVGRHCQVRINGTRGRTEVRAVAVHARANLESHRRKL
jgi:hypothetical protein